MADAVLAIVGSTTFRNPEGISIARGFIIAALDSLHPCLVVSGGAPGVDTLAAVAARARGIEVDEKLPAMKRWHPNGFKERNLLIAQSCTHLLRIVCADSKTYGSGWTADRAQELGVQVERLTVPAP